MTMKEIRKELEEAIHTKDALREQLSGLCELVKLQNLKLSLIEDITQDEDIINLIQGNYTFTDITGQPQI